VAAVDVLVVHQYQVVVQFQGALEAEVKALVIQVKRQVLVQLIQVAAVVVIDHQAELVVRLEAVALALL
jgi:hypothetical protein